MHVPQSNIIRFKSLSYSIMTAALVWYVYWILYDVAVWNKSLIQVNPLNYMGLTAMVGLILFESKIGTHRQSIRYRRSKSSCEAPSFEMEKVMALPLRIGECPYNVDYFDQPNNGQEIPRQCIQCTNIIDCACRASRNSGPTTAN
jgi:hypothetical protein